MNAIKAYSHFVSRVHNERGSSFTEILQPKDVFNQLAGGWEVVNVTGDDCAIRVVGSDLTPKLVRRILFDQRDRRAARRYGAVLWTTFVPKKGVTLVGFGAIVRVEVAERFTRLHEDYVILSRG